MYLGLTTVVQIPSHRLLQFSHQVNQSGTTYLSLLSVSGIDFLHLGPDIIRFANSVIQVRQLILHFIGTWDQIFKHGLYFGPVVT